MFCDIVNYCEFWMACLNSITSSFAKLFSYLSILKSVFPLSIRLQWIVVRGPCY